MPSDNIEFALDIQGAAEDELYTIQGGYTINTTNSTPSEEISVYSGSGAFNSTLVVLTKTVTANNGFYFFAEPQLSIAIGDQNNYSIVANKTYDVNQNLIAVQFVVSYTFPSFNVSGDSIVIQANAIQIIEATQYINAFTLNGVGGYDYTANTNGESLVLTLIGDPGALYSVELVDALLNTTVYATNVAIGSTGTAQIADIAIPNYLDNKYPYELKITGDVNPSIANDGVGITISIAQQEPVSITVRAINTNSNIVLSGSPDTVVLSANTSYTPGSEPILNFSFSAAAISPFVISQDSSVTASSFDPVIPDPLATNYTYSLSNLTSTLEEGIFTVSGTIEVYSSGEQLIIHTLDLDQIISTPPVSIFDSVLEVTDCSSTEGVGRPIEAIAQNNVVVGAQLLYLIDETTIPLAIGFYRMSNNLADGTTYQIGTIQVSSYIVQVGNNGIISNINECL